MKIPTVQYINCEIRTLLSFITPTCKASLLLTTYLFQLLILPPGPQHLPPNIFQALCWILRCMKHPEDVSLRCRHGMIMHPSHMPRPTELISPPAILDIPRMSLEIWDPIKVGGAQRLTTHKHNTTPHVEDRQDHWPNKNNLLRHIEPSRLLSWGNIHYSLPCWEVMRVQLFVLGGSFPSRAENLRILEITRTTTLLAGNDPQPNLQTFSKVLAASL